MDASLERLVWARAGDRCEYCLIPQSADELSHHIDHLVTQQHGGETVALNLALLCMQLPQRPQPGGSRSKNTPDRPPLPPPSAKLGAPLPLEWPPFDRADCRRQGPDCHSRHQFVAPS